MNSIIKITGLVVAVIVLVSLLLYLLDESHNTSADYSETINTVNSNGFFGTLNTIPDFYEQERVESLTGLNFIMYMFYLLLIVVNISFIGIIKQDESASKILIFGLYTSVSLVLFINIILSANHTTWSFNHAFKLTLNGVGAGFLASLLSICIYSLRNFFRILKEESKSIFGLLSNRILSPNINTSLVISRVWIIFTLLMSLFFIGLLWV